MIHLVEKDKGELTSEKFTPLPKPSNDVSSILTRMFIRKRYIGSKLSRIDASRELIERETFQYDKYKKEASEYKKRNTKGFSEKNRKEYKYNLDLMENLRDGFKEKADFFAQTAKRAVQEYEKAKQSPLTFIYETVKPEMWNLGSFVKPNYRLVQPPVIGQGVKTDSMIEAISFVDEGFAFARLPNMKPDENIPNKGIISSHRLSCFRIPHRDSEKYLYVIVAIDTVKKNSRNVISQISSNYGTQTSMGKNANKFNVANFPFFTKDFMGSLYALMGGWVTFPDGTNPFFDNDSEGLMFLTKHDGGGKFRSRLKKMKFRVRKGSTPRKTEDYFANLEDMGYDFSQMKDYIRKLEAIRFTVDDMQVNYHANAFKTTPEGLNYGKCVVLDFKPKYLDETSVDMGFVNHGLF